MDNEKIGIILERLQDKNSEIQNSALEMLHSEVRAAAGTITKEQQDLFDILNKLKLCVNFMNEANKKHLNDIISVLSVGPEDRDIINVIKYRLLGNITDLENWGHQYVKQLINACVKIRHREVEIFNYSPVVDLIISYLFQHNSEVEAIDFLLEISNLMPKENSEAHKNTAEGTDVNKLDLIVKHIDKDNFERIYEYLIELEKFYPLREMVLEITKCKETRHLIHLLEYNRIPEAVDYVRNIKNPKMRKQCIYILARCNVYFSGNEEEEFILTNKHIHKFYLNAATSLEIVQSKKIDYILKGLNKDKIDAAAVCNGLIHFGFFRDPLFNRHPEDYNIKKEYITLLNQQQGETTTLNASIGCIQCYEPNKIIESHASSIFEHKDVGAILSVAISSYKNQDIDDSVLNLFSGILGSENPKDVLPCLFGITLIYSGIHGRSKEEAYEKVFPLLNHPSPNVACMAIYAIGVLFTGTGNKDILSICIEVYNELDANKSNFYNFAVLGISLIFYRRPDLAESEEFLNLPKPIKIFSYGMIFVGAGKPNATEEIMNASFTGDAVPFDESLGLLASALTAISDPIATEMVERLLFSSLMLNNPHIKNVVPLCLALLYPSTNKNNIVDFLERSINSREANITSLISLGIIGAGTNSSKILNIMAANFNILYKDVKESSALIYAQGLVNLAKGMCTLNPLVYNNRVINDKSLIGLLSTIFLFLTEDTNFLQNDTYMLYSIVQAISPKYVSGIEGEIKVGKPIETVGLTGNPNKISGVVVHSMPVVLNANEKAETATEVCTDFIEDILVDK
ncbi:hypothetical protein NUSPORA_00251 [Nucleospora cyclopteri]